VGLVVLGLDLLGLGTPAVDGPHAPALAGPAAHPAHHRLLASCAHQRHGQHVFVVGHVVVLLAHGALHV